MTNYRRFKSQGGYFFFTVVTYKRTTFLCDELARGCLRNAWEHVRKYRPFETISLCLLPDHLHCIWQLPQGDSDFSTRWSLIKRGFTQRYLFEGGKELEQSLSRENKRERGIWQRRFWEHCIRNEKDLQRHVDYIHYNPVKHGLVQTVEQWPWSTYHKYVASGHYGKQFYTDLQNELNTVIYDL